MKTLLLLLIGAAIGIAAYLYFREPANRPKLDQATEQLSNGVSQVKTNISQKVAEIDTEQIKRELARTGRVVQKKAEQAGAAIADATADARITAKIKSKLAMEPDLSAMKISVNTTDGVVTLAGSVTSAEQIKRAMQIALQPDGAKEVISTLQVKPNH